MDTCKEDTHRPEFVEDAHGLIWWRCLTCGETRLEFTDNQGG